MRSRYALPVVAAMGLASLLRPAPAAADCDGPYPDFEDVARTAQTLVIGDVVAVQPGGAWEGAPNGMFGRFTLQVEHVVRGEADPVIKINDLPTQPCAGAMAARLGDRIALAVNGVAFTTRVKSNMIAWIDAPPPAEFGNAMMGGARPYTVAQVFALVGMEAPPATAAPSAADDTPAAVDTPAPSDPPILLAVAIAIALVVAAVMARTRVRRRSD